MATTEEEFITLCKNDGTEIEVLRSVAYTTYRCDNPGCELTHIISYDKDNNPICEITFTQVQILTLLQEGGKQ